MEAGREWGDRRIKAAVGGATTPQESMKGDGQAGWIPVAIREEIVKASKSLYDLILFTNFVAARINLFHIP